MERTLPDPVPLHGFRRGTPGIGVPLTQMPVLPIRPSLNLLQELLCSAFLTATLDGSEKEESLENAIMPVLLQVCHKEFDQVIQLKFNNLSFS